MNGIRSTSRRTFEILLILIVLAMTSLLVGMAEHKMVILYLFFLPVVLSGYFLGRFAAGLLAVFSAVAVTVAIMLDSTGFAVYSSPITVGLVVTVWAAVLGLTALLIGTLCDERSEKVRELHVAYVGVVEVLARYLQSANPGVKARSIRVAELSQVVAEHMRLSQKQIDDIRVGALLYDIGNVEITTKLISKAVGALDTHDRDDAAHTFQGRELVHSLEPVLAGAVPLLLNQDDDVLDCISSEDLATPYGIPLGAKIIRAARAYDALTEDDSKGAGLGSAEAIKALRKDPSNQYDDDVLCAIEACVTAHVPMNVYEESIFAS